MKDSCKVLGDMYERGRGVTADASRGSALHAKACRLGDDKACAPVAPPHAQALTCPWGASKPTASSSRTSRAITSKVGSAVVCSARSRSSPDSRCAKLDACGAHTDERVAWTGAHGAMTHLQASGSSVAVNPLRRARPRRRAVDDHRRAPRSSAVRELRKERGGGDEPERAEVHSSSVVSPTSPAASSRPCSVSAWSSHMRVVQRVVVRAAHLGDVTGRDRRQRRCPC